MKNETDIEWLWRILGVLLSWIVLWVVIAGVTLAALIV